MRIRLLAAERGLTDANQSDNIDDMMPAFERTKRSKSSESNLKTRKLRKACNAKDLSIRDLAARARKETRYKKISQAHLSMAADGMRPIDLELATWIAGQIDYPATVANWSKLRVE